MELVRSGSTRRLGLVCAHGALPVNSTLRLPSLLVTVVPVALTTLMEMVQISGNTVTNARPAHTLGKVHLIV